MIRLPFLIVVECSHSEGGMLSLLGNSWLMTVLTELNNRFENY